MFDFLDSDWFIIGLEIIFLILISYDIKRYLETKKNEYIVNIVLTLGFAIWTLLPFYNSYFGWTEKQKTEMIKTCVDSNNSELCECVDKAVFKTYIYDEYIAIDKNSTKYQEFKKETKEDCLDDGWF